MRHQIIVTVLAAASIVLLTPAKALDLAAVPLTIPHDDSILLPACASGELDRLEAEVRRAAAKRHPDAAWKTVRRMLCGERLPLDAMPQRVALWMRAYGDDEPPPQLVSRDEIPLPGARVWGSHLEEQGRDIAVVYATGEVCSGRFVLRPSRAAWLIVHVEEGCD